MADEKQWYWVTWEMRVLASSPDGAAALMSRFAVAADALQADSHYDNFDVSSLKHGEIEIVPSPPTSGEGG